MTYRKLSAEEALSFAKMIIAKKNTGSYINTYKNFAKSFYPADIAYFIVSIDSEYNDEGYSNHLGYVIGYDKCGNELPPIKATAQAARQKWKSLPLPIDSNTNEQVEDLIVYVGEATIPDLYILESL